MKAARKTLGLTQEGLAERIGLSVDSIRSYEQNKRPISNIVGKFLNAIVEQEATNENNK